MTSIDKRGVGAFLGMAIAAAMIAAGTPAMAQSAPVGVWQTEKGDARIRVSKCGSAICGKVAWLREPIDPATGRPFTDDKNPNPALASRPMIGVPLFNDMRPIGPDQWAGRIYNADDGQFYASKVTLRGPSHLHVEGCLGVLCGGEIWSLVGR